MLVSMLVEDMLSDMGHIPVGPANRLATGLAMAEEEQLDLGILDVNLGGGDLSFGIADILTRRGIPVVFATGYGAGGLTEQYADMPVIAKPFSQTALSDALEKFGAAAR